MLNVYNTIGTQPGRVRCPLDGSGELRGCRREHGSHFGARDPMSQNAQEQLKCVDQKIYLQMTYKTGQRREDCNPWTRAETQGGIERTSDGVFLRS